MLFGFHWIWAVVLLAIVLIVFGVGRLPSVGEGLGRGIREFRKSVGGSGPAQSTESESGKDSGSTG